MTINTDSESTSVSGQETASPFPNWPGGDDQRRREIVARFDGDPLPLTDENLPTFPTGTLPGPFGRMAEATVAALQVDSAMVGPMILATLSAACGGEVVAEIHPDWTETAALHVVVSAGPSERKSPTLSRITAPLYAAERSMIVAATGTREEMMARRRIADARAKNAEAAASKLDADPGHADPIEYAVKLAGEAAAIVVPPLPRIIADDVTPEAMVSRLAENGGRLAIMSAEGGMFSTLAGRYSSGVANLDAWLKGYSGEPIRVDRKGRDPEMIDHPSLTVCLATQPDVLAEACRDPRFRGQGLLARLAFAIPRPMVGRRDPAAAVPTPEAITADYSSALRELAVGLHDREDGPTTVKFSPAAREDIAALERTVDRRSASGGDLSGDLAAWGGKHVGRVVRVALLLHMAEHGTDGLGAMVSADTVAAAVRVGEFFAAHSKAAHGVVDTGGVQLTDLTTSLAYLRDRHARRPLSAFPVRDLGKSGPTVLRRKSTRDPVLDVLADLNHVVKCRTKGTGGRRGGQVVYLHPESK